MVDIKKLLDKHVLNMIKECLEIGKFEKIGADNCFYITFDTAHQDVVIPKKLRAKYLDQMTVTIQHDYLNLKIFDQGFSVILSFSGELYKIYVPFKAIINFSDTKNNFGYNFVVEKKPRKPPKIVDIKKLKENFKKQ